MRSWMFFAAFLPMLLLGCNDDSLSPEEQLARDEELILDYLAANNRNADRDPSGLYSDIAFPGNGESPGDDDFVEIRYKGYFLDNTVFDETEDDEDPLILPLSTLPRGLVIGLKMLREGGRGTFYLPGALGNGQDVLVFEVDLLGVYQTQAQVDDKKIQNYLDRKGLDAIRDETGIYYDIDNPGNNINPTTRDTVQVRYRGYLLNDVVFDESVGQSTVEFALGNLIEGWQIGLPLFEKGGSGTLYIPSELGYGEVAQGSAIPPNSVLVFDIELVDIFFEQ